MNKESFVFSPTHHRGYIRFVWFSIIANGIYSATGYARGGFALWLYSIGSRAIAARNNNNSAYPNCIGYSVLSDLCAVLYFSESLLQIHFINMYELNEKEREK